MGCGGRGRAVTWLLPVVGLGLVGGCFIDLYGGASDVPCFAPAFTGATLWLRPDGEGGFLMTTQSDEDIQEDILDGRGDAQPHQPQVYRFNSLSNRIELVNESAWDNATTPLQRCCPSLFEDGPLQLVDNRLVFEGRTVPVAGGTALDMDDAPTLPVAAVLSTNGFRTLFGAATGQHYHQLFSMETGEPVGPAMRLGVGGRNFDRTFIGWMDDDMYVLYESAMLEPLDLRYCVVPVGDLLTDLREGEP